MSSFGYSVLGFGTVATAAAGVAAPSSAVIKNNDGSVADNVTVEIDFGRPFGVQAVLGPNDIGTDASSPLEVDTNASDNIRFVMTKTVGGGTVATHAWQAILAHTAGSGATFVGGGTIETSSTSGTFTTPYLDTSSFTGGFSADVGTFTFKYTATNAGGSSAASNVVVHWRGV